MAAPGSPGPVGGTARALAAAALAVAAGALVACASPGRDRIAVPDVAGAGAGSCRLAAETEGAVGGPDTLRIGAAGPLEGMRPPLPLGPSERVAYRHLYATLVEVDCSGRIRPGLATAWTRGEDGRRWTFRLREGISPGTVLEAWRRRGVLEAAGGAASGHSLIRGASGEGDAGELTVALARPFPTPAPLADLRYAVTGATAAWMPGATGSYRLEGRTDAGPWSGAGETWTLRPRSSHAPVLRITAYADEAPPPGPDARDLLDRGVDVLLARGAGIRRYAASLPDYRLHMLPWDRTYVLLVPGAPPLRREGAGAVGGPSTTEREGGPVPGEESDAGRDGGLLADLAEDAVDVEARASRPPYWWAERCAGGERGAGDPRPPPSGAPVPRLVYPSGDDVARDLAARLAALRGADAARHQGERGLREALAAAAEAGPGPLRAVGLPEAGFRKALQGGGEAAYVFPLRRRSLDPCGARDALLRRVPWHGPGEGRLVPLVETRPFAAVRWRVSDLELGWDGTPLVPPRPAADGAGSGP